MVTAGSVPCWVTVNRRSVKPDALPSPNLTDFPTAASLRKCFW